MCTSAAVLKASSVRVSVPGETRITSPGYSTSKLGSGKWNCPGLPHAKQEEEVALCFHFPALSLSAAGLVHQKREMVIFRYQLKFLQMVSVADFISLPNLTKGNEAGLGDSVLNCRNSSGNGKILFSLRLLCCVISQMSWCLIFPAFFICQCQTDIQKGLLGLLSRERTTHTAQAVYGVLKSLLFDHLLHCHWSKYWNTDSEMSQLNIHVAWWCYITMVLSGFLRVTRKAELSVGLFRITRINICNGERKREVNSWQQRITCEGALLFCTLTSPVCSKRNYANYSQNVCAFTELCGFLLRLSYLTVLISTVSVYSCNENNFRHPTLLTPVTNCTVIPKGKYWRDAALKVSKRPLQEQIPDIPQNFLCCFAYLSGT